MLVLGRQDFYGQEVVRAIREGSRVPIFVLLWRCQETEKVEALDRGADDYVVKPFGIGELMARVRAALRQRLGADEPLVVRTGGLCLDFERRVILKDGEEVHLSKKGDEILQELARRADPANGRESCRERVWPSQ